MPTTLSTFETLFDNRVRDAASRFTPAQKDDAIAQAVKRYSQDRPLEAAQDYAGDGTTYDLALPTGWVDGVSAIKSLEYPQGQRIPNFLLDKDWQFYRSPSAQKIRLLAITPAVGQTLRARFTKLYTVTGSGSDIPSVDEEAVSDLAASIGLRALASVYAGTTDPTIAADTVDYRTKAQEYTTLADKLEKRYGSALGLDQQSDAPAASGFADTDQTSSLGQDHLTHPNRYR